MLTASSQERRVDKHVRATTSNHVRLGFRCGDRGTHSSRTLMLHELRQLLDAAPSNATRQQYRELILEENTLGKRTVSNRLKTFKHLSELYGLDLSLAVFRLFRRFWDHDDAGRPLLAVLCACARDPLLRASTEVVLDAKVGDPVAPATLAASAGRRFSPKTQAALGRNLASSWTQSGHLAGKLRKARARAIATPAAAAYAVALGYMDGARGILLLSTLWSRLLDCPADELVTLVQKAARHGWLDYRAAGDVVDIRPKCLFTPEELELCDGEPH